MSIIAPSTTVTLYHDVPITDEKNLIFKSIANQRSYFAGKVYRTSVECSYERAGAPLMLDIPISDMYKFNYISFKNEAFENKEIYARTLPPVYVNNEVLAVPYVIDYWQTFMFDVKMDKCGILRQHNTYKEYIDHSANPFAYHYSLLTPEPLAFSDSLRKNRTNGNTKIATIMKGLPRYTTGSPNDWYSPVICVQTTQKLVVDKHETNPPVYDSNTNFLSAIKSKFFDATDVGLNDMQAYINEFAEHDMISSILGVYYLPTIFMKCCHESILNDIEDGHPIDISSQLAGYSIVQDVTLNLDGISGLDDKLLHFPYMFMRVTDFLGNSKEYRIDRFSTLGGGTGTLTFGVFFTMNGYPQVVLAPKNYLGEYNIQNNLFPDREHYNFEEKMVVTEFPQVGYNTDGFLTWMGSVFRQQAIKDTTVNPLAYNSGINVAQNAMNMVGSALGGISNLGKAQSAGELAGAQISEIGGAASGILNAYSNSWNFNLSKNLHENAKAFYENPLSKEVAIPEYMARAIPMFARDDYHAGTSTGGLPAYMFDKLGFTLELISPQREIQNVYNSYFDKYGYSQNKIGKPSVFSYVSNGSNDDKPTYNSEGLTFVKTESCSVEGANMEITRAIEQMFNNGHWFAAPDNT